MFADAYAAYASNLAENAPVIVLGNVIVGNDGARLNVKECYRLESAILPLVHQITWLLRPDHPETPAFLRQMREIINRQPGGCHMAFGFVFDGAVAPVAEVSHALSWKLNPALLQELREHPAVAGVQIEAKRLELKPDRRWGRK
jgi:DNA polymerase-3 subunit alpha